MTKGWNTSLERRQCTLKRAHRAHSWYARTLRRYFQCVGSYGHG